VNDKNKTVDGDVVVADINEVLMKTFATNWIAAIKLLRRVMESHDQGFVMDGELAAQIREFIGDGNNKDLIPAAMFQQNASKENH